MAFGADRSVSVTLKANVSDYIGKVTAAGKATADFSRDAVKGADKHKKSFDMVGKGMLLTGAAIAAGVGLAVKTYADFDKSLSNVRAVSGATATQMDALRSAAIAAGQATVFSASDAADAEAELAKVGISVSDILGGALLGSMNLAAAGGIDLAQAATFAGQAMKIFKLNGADVGHIADVLAAGANKSAADVSQLGQALQQGGLVAAQTGLTLDDTVGTLSAFADNALLGSDAGTSFKTMLQRLTPQSSQARDEMSRLGLSAFDAQGQFVGITTYAGRLRAAMKDLTVEQRAASMQIIFGSDAVRAATVIYGLGAKGLEAYINGVNDQGAAARVAAIQLDNLSGDVEQLKGSLETALIGVGSGANSVLRDLIQSATGAVNAFSGLPRPVQEVGLGFAAVASAALLAGGAVLTLAPKIKPAINALGDLGLTGSRVAKFLTGPLGLAFAAGAVAVGLFVKSQLDAKHRAEELRASLDQQTGAITENTKQLVAQSLQGQQVFQRYGGLVSGNLELITNAALGNADALAQLRAEQDSVNTQLGVLAAKHGDLTDAQYAEIVSLQSASESYDGLFKAIGQTSDALNPQVSATKELGVASGAAAGAADSLAASQVDQAAATAQATSAMQDYTDAAKASGLITLSLRQATRDYQQALDDASAAAKDNGRTLSSNSEKGRKNQAALDGVAKAARDQAKAVFDSTTQTKGNDAAQDAFRASLVKSRAGLVAAGIRFGLTKKQANAYADSVLDIPVARNTKVTVQGTAAARTEIQKLRDALEGIKSKTVTLTVRTNTANHLSQPGLNPSKNAAGGYISGPGTGTSDSIPALLSNGEYVIKAAAVSKYGPSFFDRLNQMRFANGGVVPSSSGSSRVSHDRSYSFGDLVAVDVDQLARKVTQRIREIDAVTPTPYG